MKKNNSRILIVDDEEGMSMFLALLLDREGFETMVAHDGATALKMIRSEMPEVVLLDLKMPGMDGMEVLRKAKDFNPNLPVVIITAYADIRGAVEAMKAGAYSYLPKPFEHSEVIRTVRQIAAVRNFKQEIEDLPGQLQDGYSLCKMMGPSDAIARLIAEVNRVAKTDFTVLISGETGSGKELVARATHNASSRSKAPFIAVDCGAIPETLLESKLFGHEKGAFTGAHIQKPGDFELANGGTLFLDEISNMPLSSQAKLLRVLQEKTVHRIGGTALLSVDVRLLAASNQDLYTLTESGSFRSDLFFRLNEFPITIPPLRERKEDIAYLAKKFLDITNAELNKNVKGFSESAISVLIAYDWPGNVRQLKSTIRRAVLLAEDVVTEKHLDIAELHELVLRRPQKIQGKIWQGLSLREIVRRDSISLEREVLVQTLKHTGGNKARAARLLKIDYKTIHTKIKQLGISIDGGEHEEKEPQRARSPKRLGGNLEGACGSSTKAR